MVAKPTFLKVLAGFGLALGCFGAISAISSALLFTHTRDEYVTLLRDSTVKSAPSATEQQVKLIEQEADALYSRRNVALPLAGMNLILSSLLFFGCGRAARGQLWGLQAWQLAAAASIPYTILACAFALVQMRELRPIIDATPGPDGAFALMESAVERMLTVGKTALEVIYFVASWLYLRTPGVRVLYATSDR